MSSIFDKIDNKEDQNKEDKEKDKGNREKRDVDEKKGKEEDKENQDNNQAEKEEKMTEVMLITQATGTVRIRDPQGSKINWLPEVINSIYPGASSKESVLIKHALCCILDGPPTKRQDMAASFSEGEVVYCLEYRPAKAYITVCKSHSNKGDSTRLVVKFFKKATGSWKNSFIQCDLSIKFTECANTGMPSHLKSGIISAKLLPGVLGDALGGKESDKESEKKE